MHNGSRRWVGIPNLPWVVVGKQEEEEEVKKLEKVVVGNRLVVEVNELREVVSRLEEVGSLLVVVVS